MTVPNFNLAGLPVTFWVKSPEGADALAREIADGCLAAEQRKIGDVWCTLALILVLWHARLNQAPDAVAAQAIRLAMAPALDAPEVRTRLGLSERVSGHEHEEMLRAAKLDGEADAAGGAKLHRDALGSVVGVSGRTIDVWRRQDDYKARRKYVSALRPAPRQPVPKGEDAQRVWLQDRLDGRD